MKIISKYKDYYDYLMGVYGSDPKLVLDRRKGKPLFKWTPDNYETVFIAVAGKGVTGIYYDGNVYWGDQILTLPETKKYKGEKYDRELNDWVPYEGITIPNLLYSRGSRHRYFEINPDVVDVDFNDKYNCPIIGTTYEEGLHYKDGSVGRTTVFYPILKDLNVGSIFPPEQIWKMLTDWLAKKETERLDFMDSRTNKEKITGHGFDYKRSFRPKMK